ncbi:MAG TPA: GNAT family protein [bacterium]|nr:GNAT family protein [bacterium]HPN44257.1 GNAT family protein [bacterium]
MHDFLLETVRLRLRLFREDDLDALLRCRSDERVARFQLWDPFTADDAKNFINVWKEIPPGTPGSWSAIAIQLKKTCEVIGDCALKVENGENLQGEIGFNLSPVHQGRGYATEACRSLLEYAFRELKLHRIIAVMDADNKDAIALCERVGMRREAYYKQNTWYKNHWGDEVVFAILQKEFLAANESGII